MDTFPNFAKKISQDPSGGVSNWGKSFHEVKFGDVQIAGASIPSISTAKEPALPGMVSEDDFRDPQSAPPFQCLCGFTAFSQMLYEDHECKFVMKAAVKASVMADSISRLKDAGLHVERQLGDAGVKQGPQTVLVKVKDTQKVLFGPRPVEKDMSVAKLIERILEVKKQPWASVKLFLRDKELSPDLTLLALPERSLLLQAEVCSTTLEIQGRKNFFNKFPDVTTEVSIAPQTEEDYEADVKKVREQLRSVGGRYRMTREIEAIDAIALLSTLEERPKSLSCVPLQGCLSEDQLSQLRDFIPKAKTARVWKHEGFGQYYVMGWAAGHKLRLSIISEDVPARFSVNKISFGN